MINVTDAVTVKFKLKLSQLIDVVSVLSSLSSLSPLLSLVPVSSLSPLLPVSSLFYNGQWQCHCHHVRCQPYHYQGDQRHQNHIVIVFILPRSKRIMIVVFKTKPVKFDAFLENLCQKCFQIVLCCKQN